MNLDELMRRRRMVHRFESRRPPRELVDEVLEAALHAPSAGFSQGFTMLVIDDPERIDWFWDATIPPGEENPVQPRDVGPPVLVVTLVNASIYTERYSRPDKLPAGLQSADAWPVPYWWVDAGMAVMLVLLAAVEHRLGGWFFGISQGEEEVRKGLDLPDGQAIVGVIGLGYQAADDKKMGSSVTIPRRRLEDVVRRDSTRPPH